MNKKLIMWTSFFIVTLISMNAIQGIVADDDDELEYPSVDAYFTGTIDIPLSRLVGVSKGVDVGDSGTTLSGIEYKIIGPGMARIEVSTILEAPLLYREGVYYGEMVSQVLGSGISAKAEQTSTVNDEVPLDPADVADGDQDWGFEALFGSKTYTNIASFS